MYIISNSYITFSSALSVRHGVIVICNSNSNSKDYMQSSNSNSNSNRIFQNVCNSNSNRNFKAVIVIVIHVVRCNSIY